MNQLSLLEPEPTGANRPNGRLADLMDRWREALARKEAIPVKDREGRIEADSVAYDIEREIVEALEGRIPAVVYHRGAFYVLSRSMLLQAELINLEEQA